MSSYPSSNPDWYDDSSVAHHMTNDSTGIQRLLRAIESNDLTDFCHELATPHLNAGDLDNAAIITAATLGSKIMVYRLLKKKCVDPSHNDNEAVFRAVLGGHLEVFKFLINDHRIWWCPLHAVCLAIAQQNRYTDIVQYIEGFDHTAYHHSITNLHIRDNPIINMGVDKLKWRLSNHTDFRDTECFAPHCRHLNPGVSPGFCPEEHVDTFLSLRYSWWCDLSWEFGRFPASRKTIPGKENYIVVPCIR